MLQKLYTVTQVLVDMPLQWDIYLPKQENSLQLSLTTVIRGVTYGVSNI